MKFTSPHSNCIFELRLPVRCRVEYLSQGREYSSTIQLYRCQDVEKLCFFGSMPTLKSEPNLLETQLLAEKILQSQGLLDPCLSSNLNPISCRRNCAISRPDDSEKELTLVALEREIEAILVRENRFNCQISEKLQDWIISIVKYQKTCRTESFQLSNTRKIAGLNHFDCQISENLQDWISFNGHGSEVWGCFELWSVFVECGTTLK